MYGQSVRTNNDVEGWHNRIKCHAKRYHLPFYLLIILLHKESQLINIQAKLLSDAKLKRYQRKKYKQLQSRIFNLWDSYKAGKKDNIQFIKSVRSFVRPCCEVLDWILFLALLLKNPFYYFFNIIFISLILALLLQIFFIFYYLLLSFRYIIILGSVVKESFLLFLNTFFISSILVFTS